MRAFDENQLSELELEEYKKLNSKNTKDLNIDENGRLMYLINKMRTSEVWKRYAPKQYSKLIKD